MLNKIEKDDLGRIIYEEREDGFWEKTEYYENGNIKRVETHYPEGQVEIEKFGGFNT